MLPSLFENQKNQKSKLAQPASKNDHKICWKERKILQIETNATKRKRKGSADMSARSCGQSTQLPHLAIIVADVRKIQHHPM
jgi:hypothetical protein